MAFLPAAVVDGALVKAEQIRRIAFFSTGGETTIARGGDLKVVPTATASTSVVIMPGSASISAESTYGGAQSYVVVNDAAVTVPVPANTTGATRTLRVIVAVRDPQYAGMPVPSDPDADFYLDVLIQATVPKDRPCLVLATITQPAGSGVIAASAIDDGVRPFRPREYSDEEVIYPSSDTNMSKTAYGSWPLSGFSVRVPTWANQLRVNILVNGTEYTGTDRGLAGVRVIFGDKTAQNGIVTSNGKSRQSINCMGRLGVDADERGTLKYIGLQAYQSQGAGNFQHDYQSQVSIRWTFQEVLR